MSSSDSVALHFECLTSPHALGQVREVWQEDLGVDHPFLSFGWMNSWWNSFGTNHSLYLVMCYQESKVRMLAPCYLHSSLARGKEIRFLGSGRACSDHMTLLQHPKNSVSLTRIGIEGIAQFIASDPSWDMVNLDGVSQEDETIDFLAACLQRREIETRFESDTNTWQLELPATWDEYVAGCPKKIRQKLRRVLRDADQHEVNFHLCDTSEKIDRYFDTFVDLHVRRRTEVQGDQGCFETEAFEEFLRSGVKRFHNDGQLWLGQLDIDGVAAACCVGFESNGTLYFYQCGSDPQFSAIQPGWLLNAKLIQSAIGRGLHTIDYLRGDERYKAKLSATPTGQRRLLAVANHVTSKTRDRLWQTARLIKQTLVQS